MKKIILHTLVQISNNTSWLNDSTLGQETLSYLCKELFYNTLTDDTLEASLKMKGQHNDTPF